jgi:hypothetical protein
MQILRIIKNIVFAVLVYAGIQVLLLLMFFFMAIEGERFFSRFGPKDEDNQDAKILNMVRDEP